MAKKEIKQAVDPWSIISYPNLSEKSINAVEGNNTLVFIVHGKANKTSVRWAVEKLFSVKVTNVNINNDQRNRKKAYVRLDEKSNALDIATRMGMI